jgi:DNA-binding transcriptional ArsR family regulator
MESADPVLERILEDGLIDDHLETVEDAAGAAAGSAAVVEQVTNYFRVLGEPMRLRLLNVLRDGERCVQELVDETETSQANVSKHLKVMLQAGILAKRNQGTQAFYRVADDLIFELCNLVCDRLASRIEQQALHFRTFNLASKPETEELRIEN